MSRPATHSTPTDPTCVPPRYSDRNPKPVRSSSIFWKAPIASRLRHMPQPVARNTCAPPKRCSTVRPPCPWVVPSPQCRASATPRARQAPERHSPSSSLTASARASASLRKLALSANGASYRLNTPRNSVLGDITRRTTTFAWVISAALFWRKPSISNRLTLAMNCVPGLPPSSLTCCRLYPLLPNCMSGVTVRGRDTSNVVVRLITPPAEFAVEHRARAANHFDSTDRPEIDVARLGRAIRRRDRNAVLDDRQPAQTEPRLRRADAETDAPREPVVATVLHEQPGDPSERFVERDPTLGVFDLVALHDGDRARHDSEVLASPRDSHSLRKRGDGQHHVHRVRLAGGHGRGFGIAAETWQRTPDLVSPGR